MITYKPLFKILIDRNIMKKDLAKGADISNTTISKLSNDKVIRTDIIDKICSYLSCQPNDIMLHIKDKK